MSDDLEDLPVVNVDTAPVDQLQPDSISTPSAPGAPQTASSSALAMLGFGGLLKGVGQIASGIQQTNSFAQKASVDRYNATIQTQNAATIGAETALNEQNLRMFQAQKIGQQRANLAQAGIGPISAGSAGDAINQSEVNANMQALTERFKGNVARTNSINSAQLDNYYASINDSNATKSEFATGASATASLLEGANKLYQAF